MQIPDGPARNSDPVIHAVPQDFHGRIKIRMMLRRKNTYQGNCADDNLKLIDPCRYFKPCKHGDKP